MSFKCDLTAQYAEIFQKMNELRQQREHVLLKTVNAELISLEYDLHLPCEDKETHYTPSKEACDRTIAQPYFSKLKPVQSTTKIRNFPDFAKSNNDWSEALYDSIALNSAALVIFDGLEEAFPNQEANMANYLLNWFGGFYNKLSSYVFAARIPNQKLVIEQINDINNSINALDAFSDAFNFWSNLHGLAEQVCASILDRLQSYKTWLNRFLLRILPSLKRKYKSKKGIGKGVEGYIPFITWARGSLNSQLVNQHSLLTS